MYIDTWYDRHTRSYVIQVKDEEGNEVECAYTGDKPSRDYEVKGFCEKYRIKDDKYKAQAKYDANNTTKITLKLNINTDADILEQLNAQDSKQGYIKRLIREDMKCHEMSQDKA